ncbi:hypothetical protein HOY80DRAFT_966301 [Tuber brumale]|nr:hypothetical protein HOY80DRAFT_966301 [Tuber brumale]
MPPRTLTPALRMRFLYPPATRPISTTPHLSGSRSYPKKPRSFSKGTTTKIPKKRGILNTTPFASRQPHHRAPKPPKLPKPPRLPKPRKLPKPPKPGPAPPVNRKVIPKGPCRDLIHYIPPSNPVRQILGPGMYYNTKIAAHRHSSTPLDKDLETEYMYTLMLRRTFSTPVAPTGSVTLKFAVKRCMEASGAHGKATTTRLRKGFLGEAVGTRLTKNKAWVCDKARATLFDWDLHEHMRFIRGQAFTGREVDYSTSEGQVLGAQGLERTNSEEVQGKRPREATEALHGDNATTATAVAAAATASAAAATKIAGIAVSSDYGYDGSDGNGKIRDDWVFEGSGSDTDIEVLMTGGEDSPHLPRGRWVNRDAELDSDGKLRDDRILEDSASDTDFDPLMTAQEHEEEEKDGDGEGGGDGGDEV